MKVFVASTIRHALLISTFAVSPVFAATSTASGRDTSFAFVFDDARLWVETRIGTAPQAHWFVLDTGAASHALDEKVAAHAGFHAADAGKWGGAGSGESSVGAVDNVDLHAGDVLLHAIHANTLPLETLLADTSGRHVGGILGAPLFAEQVVDIDFENHVVCLHDPASYRYTGPGQRIAVTLRDGLPLARGSLTLPDGHALGMRVLLDLGAKSTLLVAEPFIDKHRLRSAFPSAQVSRLGAGLGGPTRYAFARTARIAIDSVVVDHAIAGLSVDGTLKATWYDALLGADFLSRFRVIFDLPHRQVIFVPRQQALAAVEFDMSGLFVRATGAQLQRFLIDEVRTDSPASKAGLRAGDEIVSIDDVATPSMHLGDLRERLKSNDARRVKIGYRRGETVDAATLSLRRLE